MDIGIRTSNRAEQEVCRRLEGEGYTVLKNGWPDFLAFRDNEVRFIEVKPNVRCKMSPRQVRMASALRRCGIRVEMAYGDMSPMPYSKKKRKPKLWNPLWWSTPDVPAVPVTQESHWLDGYYFGLDHQDAELLGFC
jgi:hypothetical protein